MLNKKIESRIIKTFVLVSQLFIHIRKAHLFKLYTCSTLL